MRPRKVDIQTGPFTLSNLFSTFFYSPFRHLSSRFLFKISSKNMAHLGRLECTDSVRGALSNSTGDLKSKEILEISKYNPPQWFCSTSLFVDMYDRSWFLNDFKGWFFNDLHDFSCFRSFFHVFWDVGKIKESEKSLSEVVSFF